MTTLSFHPTHSHVSATHSFFADDPYIENFWLPLLGPTATLLINNLTLHALLCKNTFVLAADELSLSIGNGSRTGTTSPVYKQLNRLCQTGIFYQLSTNEYLVPRAIGPLAGSMTYKLSPAQKVKHDQWLYRLDISPLATQRRRLRALVTRLEIMGLDNGSIQSSLMKTGLHPSIIAEAITTATKTSAA